MEFHLKTLRQNTNIKYFKLSACFAITGPATAPVGCHVTDVTSFTALVTCFEDFDGGSPAHYAIGIKLSSEMIIKDNRTSPEFSVSGLLANSTYTVRVCVTNEKYWNSEDCTSEFVITTSTSNGLCYHDDSHITIGFNVNMSDWVRGYLDI